jgi:hypothetical protein
MKIPSSTNASAPRAIEGLKRPRDNDQPREITQADDDDDEDYFEQTSVHVKLEHKPQSKVADLKTLKALWPKTDLATIDTLLNTCIKTWTSKGETSKANKLRNALFYHTIVGKISWEIFQTEATRHTGEKNFQLKKSMHDAVVSLANYNTASLARIKDQGIVLP